jgi:RNA polymerase sigma-70 factor (ECF subfamily)
VAWWYDGVSESPETRPTLLLRIRDPRDGLAWGEFVEIYAPLIHGYARHRGLQDADAADLTQDVLQTIAAKVHGFQYDPSQGSFRGWLFTTTLNKLRDRARKKSRVDGGSGDTGLHALLEAQPSREEEETWNQQHQWRLFLWAAERAKPDFRPATWQAFWETAVEHKPAKEVASRLKMTVGAVHIAKSRALRRLRELIQTVEDAEFA